MITNKFGKTIDKLPILRKKKKNIFLIQLGIQLLKNIQNIHQAGYVFNNLMLRNIIVDDHSVKLIDFGNCVEYRDENGKHYANLK